VLAARRSLAVTELLMDHLDSLHTATERDFYQFSGCYYASYFHAGLAIENAAKAVLISRDPSIIENGNLKVKKFGSGSGHALLDPVLSIFGSLFDEERHLLTKLEEFVWAGRYTVPTKADMLYDEEKMNIMRLSTPDERVILRRLIDRLCQQAKS
jgi:hypothetical protein